MVERGPGSGHRTQHKREVKIPEGATVRVPEDVLAFAEVIFAATGHGFQWGMRFADTDMSGTDVDSLRVALPALLEPPRSLQITGHRRVPQSTPGVSELVGFVYLSFDWVSSVQVSGDDLDWVAGTRDRLQAESQRRLRALKIPWWRRHALAVSFVPALIGAGTVEVVLLAVLRTESIIAVAMALAVASLGGLLYERLRQRGVPPIRFVLSSADNSPARSWTQHPFFEFVRTVGPIATIVSATVAVTVLTLAVSDRCNAPKGPSPQVGTTVPATLGVAPSPTPTTVP